MIERIIIFKLCQIRIHQRYVHCSLCSCREEQTVQWNSPKCLCFSSTLTCGQFFHTPTTNCLKNTQRHCWHTLYLMLMCAASTPILVYYQPHVLLVPGTGNAPEKWRWIHVHSFPGSEVQTSTPTQCSWYIWPCCVVSWEDYEAKLKRGIVPQDEHVCMLVWLAAVMRLSAPASLILPEGSYQEHTEQIAQNAHTTPFCVCVFDCVC